MDVELDAEQSAAVRKALKTYLSDLRMEIVDTDNPAYRRDLREERASLEAAMEKLDAAAAKADHRDENGNVVVRWVSIWSVDE
jgi:hypothetical protein